MTTPEDGGAELGALVDELAERAAAETAEPAPLMAGTFALYVTPDGGLMLVTDIPDGPWSEDPRTAGIVGRKHTRVPAGIIRAMSALGGGGKANALRALLRGR